VGRYVVKRLLMLLPVLAVVGIVAFLLIHLIPGDPTSVILGTDATPQQVAQLRHDMGLDRPLVIQFGEWALRVLRGDLGQSVFQPQPVTTLIMNALPATLTLTGVALVVSILVGIPAGIIAAIRRGGIVDLLVMLVAMAGLSVPSFWLGLNLVYLFSVKLRWFPTGGYQPLSAGFVALKYLFLPGLSLGLVQAALIARMTRSAMLDVLQLDYIRTAQAKGLPQRAVILRHALRNAFIPVLTVIGTSVGVMLGGAVIIETVFTMPGLGKLVINAVKRRDFPVVQGSMLLVATISVLVNLLVDMLYASLDPRIRYS
jgi:peptide/nickel transport system permease protein